MDERLLTDERCELLFSANYDGDYTFIKLSARVPIVQYALKNNIESDKELENVLGDYLARSTALRRRRNTWYLVSAIRGEEL